MVPILFEASATTFNTMGLGALSDAITCKVYEEINSYYELEMVYPISGVHYKDIAQKRIIYAKGNFADDPQPFRIYEISKPMNGQVTIRANHISYDMSGIPVSFFRAENAVDALAGLKSHALIDCPFTLTTTKEDVVPFSVNRPASMRSWLGGQEFCILYLYGGEWHFDGFNATLEDARGEDRGVTIYYGKNLTSLQQDENCDNVYSGVYPYYTWSANGIVHPEVLNYYLASSKSSGVTTSDPGWSVDVPRFTEEKKYFWHYKAVKGSGGPVLKRGLTTPKLIATANVTTTTDKNNKTTTKVSQLVDIQNRFAVNNSTSTPPEDTEYSYDVMPYLSDENTVLWNVFAYVFDDKTAGATTAEVVGLFEYPTIFLK